MTGLRPTLGDRSRGAGARLPRPGRRHNPNEEGKQFSKVGARHAILNDLSPAAAFISYNYNTPVDTDSFERNARRILKVVEEELGWMYETVHTDGRTKGRINYTVWSDVFTCHNCQGEVVFMDVALDDEGEVSAEGFQCNTAMRC